ncbi:hypothetical protein E3N88_08356 [Mikania micrantha]|uniref:MINDY deubiquitinase domain-containing protein n=1 Tax=Mikania micrantha TaxID=192012 RepID=A0A5N6PFZ2_9ASTR|nr:hypothetical protein E3N88_08337 [Mikania micrantha]KAD6453650.1 hypothetical protein E3N88_08356 [Mikania micrantha]
MASSSEKPVKSEQTPEIQERMYKTKVIKFLGRNTPIILQNDNGPCPLIAVCNVLLLRNKLGLSHEATEVPQGRLFTLVAEQLIATSSNNKGAGRVENQLQRIADAIDLLPSFATGINVDIKFNRINEFEFTRERAVFDLLGIPMYHGWIVDPQDSDTANVIGTKSYNTLMEELATFHSRNMDALKLTETVHSVPRIRPNDDLATFETNNASHSESGKHETKDGIEMVTIAKKTENSDDDKDGSSFRFSDDWVTFETDSGKDVGSSSEAGVASHDDKMKNSDSGKHESCSPAPNVDQESSKEDGITATQAYMQFGGSLYILVTDQGYIFTPGLVWEKLHEVTGDTLFANSNFKIFKPTICEIEELSDDENANLASVFNFLANPDKTAALGSTGLNSDLQFLKALEQYEREEQTELAPPAATFPSGLIVGPEQNYSPWPRNQSALSRTESKRSRVKEKCHLM